jgi:hypothetical protein
MKEEFLKKHLIGYRIFFKKKENKIPKFQKLNHARLFTILKIRENIF